jgi:hypothetical protein
VKYFYHTVYLWINWTYLQHKHISTLDITHEIQEILYPWATGIRCSYRTLLLRYLGSTERASWSMGGWQCCQVGEIEYSIHFPISFISRILFFVLKRLRYKFINSRTEVLFSSYWKSSSSREYFIYICICTEGFSCRYTCITMLLFSDN